MKTSELIDFFQSHTFTETQGYNLLVSDINEAVTDEELKDKASQKLLRYFLYKVQDVLFPVIQSQKEKLESVIRVAEMETSDVVAGINALSQTRTCETCGGHAKEPTVTCTNHDQWVPKEKENADAN